jgi:hypothetical protein
VTSFAEFDIRTDDTIRTDFAGRMHLRAGIDDRCGMNVHGKVAASLQA